MINSSIHIKKPIIFKINFDSTVIEIETYKGEYKNLMVLLRDRLILDGFGACGGMGRCGTCLINTENIRGDSVNKVRNEPTTLAKLGVEMTAIRLACQLLINEDFNGATIEIIEEY